MSWLFLTLAIVLEVCGTTCMKLSEGLSRLIPSILIFVFYGFSFAAFTLALRRMDLSFAYAVWAGLGVLLIGTIGILYFKEPISALKIISMLFIVGVLKTKITGEHKIRSGLEMILIGIVAFIASYSIGTMLEQLIAGI